MPISIERSKFTKVLGINRKSMRKKRGIKLERKKCDMSSRSPLYSYRYSYAEWMGGQVRKYEEATANIYKYFRGINIWRSPVFGKHVSRVVIFSTGEKKLRFRSTGRKVNEWVSTSSRLQSPQFHERWSFEPRVHTARLSILNIS